VVRPPPKTKTLFFFWSFGCGQTTPYGRFGGGFKAFGGGSATPQTLNFFFVLLFGLLGQSRLGWFVHPLSANPWATPASPYFIFIFIIFGFLIIIIFIIFKFIKSFANFFKWKTIPFCGKQYRFPL
jgi:hypothetical protein